MLLFLVTSEPPDVKNWYSSYGYQSPALGTSDQFEDSLHFERELDNFVVEDSDGEKEEELAVIRKVRSRYEEVDKEEKLCKVIFLYPVLSLAPFVLSFNYENCTVLLNLDNDVIWPAFQGHNIAIFGSLKPNLNKGAVSKNMGRISITSSVKLILFVSTEFKSLSWRESIS